MLSNKKFVLVVIIGLLLCNVLLVIFMLMGPPPPPLHKEPRSVIIDKLSFETSQVNAYDKLIAAHRNKLRQLEKDIISLKNELYSTLRKNNNKEIEPLLNSLAEKHKAIEKLHYEHFFAIKDLCNDDQEEAFEALTYELAELFSRHPKPPNP